MQLHWQAFTVHKRFPLTISRGTTAESTNLWLRITHEGIEGWGEASPFSIGEQPQTTDAIAADLARIQPQLAPLNPWQRQTIEQILQAAQVLSGTRAAIDLALHDWCGKQIGKPLWQWWGLDRDRIGPTSVTIGINPPEVVRQRVQAWLDLTQAQSLKLKLGSPQGLEADRALVLTVKETAPQISKISVDANGGWSLEDAITMSHWLAEQGITYLEQPLPRGQEADLPTLKARSPLPIFVDESCWTSGDIRPLADGIHGINIKLMKCGGLSEALRMIHTARACGLQVMLGCYSDSALLNTAAAHLAPLVDHLDLDSHLNLLDDPFWGADLVAGSVRPNHQPGLGVQQRARN